MSRRKIREAIDRFDAKLRMLEFRSVTVPEVVRLHLTNSPDRCFYCGLPAETEDHLKARRWGGTNSPANIVTACDRCNQLKGCRRLRIFRRFFENRIFWAERVYGCKLS